MASAGTQGALLANRLCQVLTPGGYRKYRLGCQTSFLGKAILWRYNCWCEGTGNKKRRKKTQTEWKKCRTWFPAHRLRQWDSSNLDIPAKKIIQLECSSPISSCDPSLCAWPPRQLRNSRHFFPAYKKSWSWTAVAGKTNKRGACPPLEAKSISPGDERSLKMGLAQPSPQLTSPFEVPTQGRGAVGHDRNSRLDPTHCNVGCATFQVIPLSFTPPAQGGEGPASCHALRDPPYLLLQHKPNISNSVLGRGTGTSLAGTRVSRDWA